MNEPDQYRLMADPPAAPKPERPKRPLNPHRKITTAQVVIANKTWIFEMRRDGVHVREKFCRNETRKYRLSFDNIQAICTGQGMFPFAVKPGSS